ncbi:VWA domain-containing protein [Alteromonas sp. 345S023]|uniref:VWA domain-containing protein n=1 Tax=Alteromonas profundi TaxID=2696062 RepID=A0A7X5LKN4_9ALTE|nr:VWA domain-containing protein [Alteromonas profundi]NDV91118.1 VWA domain-containing protein [Alteromonas profundi]
MPIQDFHFIRPEWLWAIVPALGLLIWLKMAHKKQSGWQSVIPPHLYKHMLIGQVQKGKRPPYSWLFFIWLLSIFAMAGPTWERLPQPVYQLKTGHVIVVDMSLSMRATDVNPNRLTRAKYKAIDLVNRIGEGEMGLVAYAGDAFVISPLTKDAANITTLIPSLAPEIMPIPGSDPLLGIEQAAQLLTNAGYSKGAIYWITDGIDRQQQQELQAFVSSMPFTLNALIVGTDEGAPITQKNGELLKDNSGGIVIPRVNADAVTRIANAGDGIAERLTNNDDDIEALASLSLLETGVQTEQESEENEGDQWRELGPYLLLVMLPFIALGFRKGLVFSLVLCVYFPFSSDTAYAQQTKASSSTSDTRWWKAPFLNKDQEGFQHYSEGNYETAASQFDDPAWQGAAHYKAGNYEAALNAYQQVNTIDGLYNKANSLAHLGKLDEAIAAYEEVLEAAPDHQDAIDNKALLEALKQQQEQEQQEQQNQQSQNEDGQSDEQPQNEESPQSPENDSESSQNENSDDAQQQNNASQDSGSQDQDSGEQQGSEEQNGDEPPNDTAEDENREQQENAQPENEQNSNTDDKPSQAAAQQGELTDEEKEQQQRIESLMRRVPDDPAFLLKRKMQLEAQKRQRQRMPSNRSDW